MHFPMHYKDTKNCWNHQIPPPAGVQKFVKKTGKLHLFFNKERAEKLQKFIEKIQDLNLLIDDSDIFE